MKIVYTNSKGGVSIVHPAKQASVAFDIPWVGTVTEREYLEFVIAKDVPKDCLPAFIVGDDEIPSDRSSRDRWFIEGGKIKVRD